MSADKYPSIFSRQMETIVYIFSRQMEAIVYIYVIIRCHVRFPDAKTINESRISIFLRCVNPNQKDGPC